MATGDRCQTMDGVPRSSIGRAGWIRPFMLY